MNTINILNKAFSSQDFSERQPYAEMREKYKDIGRKS